MARLLANRSPREPNASALRAGAVFCGIVTVALGLVNAQQPEPVFKVGKGVSAPSVLHRVDPEYSPRARVAKVHGTVLLRVVIGPDGLAHDVGVVKGVGSGLDEKAIEAVRAWRFRPGRRNGVPVAVRAQMKSISNCCSRKDLHDD